MKIFYPSVILSIISNTLYAGTSPPEETGKEAVAKRYTAAIMSKRGKRQDNIFPRRAIFLFFIKYITHKKYASFCHEMTTFTFC